MKKQRFSRVMGILLVCICVAAHAQESNHKTTVKDAKDSWEKVRAKHADEFQALQVFMSEHSKQAQYLPDVERLFLQHLRETSGRLQANKVLKDLKVDGIQSSTAVTASESESGLLKFEEGSTVSYLLNGRENLLGDGAIHRWRGKVQVTLPTTDGTNEEYTFVGDENDPLTFGLIHGVGWVHLHGFGTVILPGGNKRTFEKPEKDQPSSRITETKTTQEPDAEGLPRLLNDYLIYVINALPQQMAPPEARHALKQTAETIAQQYKVPLSPAMENPYVHFPRETCRGVFDQETRLMVPEFLDKWVDLMGVATIKDRGDFPQIFFKGFRVTLVKDADKYRVGFPDGARAKVGDKTYTYATATGKWVESKE